MGTNKILLLDIGHFESEKHIKLIIQEYLKKKLPNFTILLSEKNVNPVNYY
jgi:putative NIF3 family GTP cyclohydrolase 1 type 2